MLYAARAALVNTATRRKTLRAAHVTRGPTSQRQALALASLVRNVRSGTISLGAVVGALDSAYDARTLPRSRR